MSQSAPAPAAGRPSRPATPPGRYGGQGRGRRGRRLAGYLALGIVGLALAAAGLALALRGASPGISWGVRGYSVLGPTAVRVDFEVRKAARAVAVCTVRARDRLGREVGRADVTVAAPGAGRRTTQVSYRLTTRGRAVTGELAGCRVARTG